MQERARAAITIIHGYDEHSGRYQRFAAHFVALGFSVYGFDLRGHGRSAGKRGYIDRFSDYLMDADAFLQLVREIEPDRPVFLLGHSMGGLIAALYAQAPSNHLLAVVLSSPFLRLKMPVPIWKLAAARVLSRFAPSLKMPNDIPVELITHDKVIEDETRADPLNHHIATPRWLTETLKAQKEAMAHAEDVRTPLALLYPGDDRIADVAETERFFELVPGDKIAHRYSGYYHEIFNEVGRAAVFDDLHAWLGDCLTQSPEKFQQGTDARNRT